VKTLIPKRFGLDPIRDVQVLCPMNRGGVGARSLNIELQAALNPAGDRNTGVTRGKKLVVLVGQKKAVAIGRRRWSKLHEWLLAR
jgi:ATP-dependent exoDNAse (exonuclease V) alpha subunit